MNATVVSQIQLKLESRVYNAAQEPQRYLDAQVKQLLGHTPTISNTYLIPK